MFAPLPFLHIPEDSRITLRLVNPKNRLEYSLSIYYSSSTGERESTEYITEDEKDQFDIKGVPKVRSSTL